MKANNIGEFLHLQEKVRLHLEIIELRKVYKSLVSSMGHDLISPLAYLEFSTEILVSQLEETSSKDLKETARVIASSTKKLSDEGKQILKKSNSKIAESNSKKRTLEELIISSLDLTSTAGISIQTNEDILLSCSILYEYIIANVLFILKTLNFNIERISLVLDNWVVIKFELTEMDSEDVLDFQNEIKKTKALDIFNSAYEYLNTDIEIQGDDSRSILLKFYKL